MPKGPMGGMQLPGGFGGVHPQFNAAMGQAGTALAGPQFQPIKNKIDSVMPASGDMMGKMIGNTQLPPNVQAMIQAIMGGAAPPQDTATTQPPLSTDQSAGGGSFWNPNHGVQRPSIGNTPATTTPFTPFSMPLQARGGVPPPIPGVRGGVNNNYVPQSPNYNIK